MIKSDSRAIEGKIYKLNIVGSEYNTIYIDAANPYYLVHKSMCLPSSKLQYLMQKSLDKDK